MEWVFGGLILVAFGAVLRRVLRMNSDEPKPSGPVPLGLAREAIYRPIALELETQASILGISLNDAFEERDSGHPDNAWCLVQLSTSEWRSEEHTSELQSRLHLVCRLLLEKKKK